MDEFASTRCVVFDLDDTLWPCEPTITHAENALYEWLQIHYPKITQCYSADQLRAHRVEFAQSNPQLSHDVTALRKASLASIAEEFSYPAALADEGLAWFRKYRNRVELYPDSLSTIVELVNSYQTGVITNGNADVEAIGLGKYFDFIVTAEVAGAAKPDREIFEYARAITGLENHELLYVGDHPELDIVGASNSGWKTVWFNLNKKPWPEVSIRPDAEIQNISELLNILSI